MARLTDLPPEIRLKIYDLLLVDPVRDGLRITMTFDSLTNNKTTWGRARCAQTDQPHKQGHSAHPCCVDVPRFTLHHLDFTDLWSLARTSKILYVEATPIIYNNADLVYSPDQPNPATNALKSHAAFALLNCYMEQHNPTTKAMLHSLVIQDKSATMSAKDMKFVVDIVNSHLPNLCAFGYNVSENEASSPSSPMIHSHRSVCRIFKAVQPLARLKVDVRLSLELPVPADLLAVGSPARQRLIANENLVGIHIMRSIRTKVKGRRAMHDYHETALQGCHHLRATLALRSKSATKQRVSKNTASAEKIERNLVRMQHLADNQHAFRKFHQYACQLK